jgi:DNA repair protein RecN (Recombination protein N)
MIIELAVENLAIIERARVTLGPGYTAMTGETGAGKSLLIDAIELALGGRADADLVRTGLPRATVSLTLDIANQPNLLRMCADTGVEIEDGVLYIQREVSAEGRSTARIGGRLVPIGVLRRLGEALVDLHGQHEHQSLLDPARHGGFLDAWIGESAQALLGSVADVYTKLAEARKKLAQLQSDMRQRAQRLDMLRYQVGEIRDAAPRAGEAEEIEAQVGRLRNVERLRLAAESALEALATSDFNARDAVSASVKSLEEASRVDSSLEQATAPIRDALFSVEEGVRLLRAYVENLETDPERMEELAARLDALRKLRQKYGESEDQVLEFLAEAESELALLEGADESEEDLRRDCARWGAELTALAAKLTEIRTSHSATFARCVEEQLRDLAMDSATFTVSIEPKEIDATGGDTVEFYFSANVGETPRALARIASGGEISRVMLAIKTVLAGRAGVPTLIFDEVDAGLGGRVAAIVARKLEELSRAYQVIVISHLPQIAGRAANHFHIEKSDIGGRTVTRVVALEGENRVEEIARMLAGEKISSSSIANARELLGHQSPGESRL